MPASIFPEWRVVEHYLTHAFSTLALLAQHPTIVVYLITMHKASIPRIVITGAPASGKTVFFERLRVLPVFEDYLFFEELARKLLAEDPTYRERWTEFHREIYRRQLARENDAGERPFISDRGTVDAFAFHPETVTDVDTTIEREYRRYTAIVQLGSSGQLGENYYPVDEIRSESIDQALAVERMIRHVWSRHPAYHFIPAEISMETKYSTFESLIMKLTGN